MSILKEELKEELLFQLDGYLNCEEDEDTREFDKQYGPLFGYSYIRDYLSYIIYSETENEQFKKLIDELDGIISGNDKRFSDSYMDTINAVDRCDEILNEIKELITEDEEE